MDYARGGGASRRSGTSSSTETAGATNTLERMGRAVSTTGGSMAAGPRSEAATVASGSTVARHEQGALDVADRWCIGHIAPGSCTQVHSSAITGLAETHIAAGAAMSTVTWQTSHAHRTHAR